ncbi:MAG: hypothetical protein AB1757_04525 [Acidobacteriota bacterium]
MARQIKIAIQGRDDFWARAFHVEWEDQFPERKLLKASDGHFIAQEDWLADLEQVAGQTFCKIIRAPENPRRRAWINSLIPNRNKY